MYGQDFAHRDAKSLDNLDKLVNALNLYAARKEISNLWDFQVSTPTDYVAELYHEAREKAVFDTEEKDFWAYNLHSVEGAYWTGYFTTYPEIKKEMYEFGDFVQSTTQIINLTPPEKNDQNQGDFEEELFKTLSIQQHHDAITGTHSPNVASDYRQMMSKSRADALGDSNHKNEDGLLANALKEDSRAQGIEQDFTSLETCTLEGHVITCTDK